MLVSKLRQVLSKEIKTTGIIYNTGSCVSILVHFSNGTCLKCDLRDLIGRGPSGIFGKIFLISGVREF